MHRHLLLSLFSALLVAGCGEKDDPGTDSGAATDADGDGFVGADDCDDNDAAVYPGATETCNLVDDNCDGQVDEGVTTTFYADNDGDGAGNPDATLSTCSEPSGYVSSGDDCDDNDASAYPSASESCDDVDNDCDGDVDEGVTSTFYADLDGDGYGDPAVTVEACEEGDGAVSDDTDCDDTHASVYPGAAEICDGLDNDCDGVIESGGTVSWSANGESGPWTDISQSFGGTADVPAIWPSNGDGWLCLGSGTHYANLHLEDNVVVQGAEDGGSVLSGGSVSQVISVMGEEVSVELANLTLQDGLADVADVCRLVSRSNVRSAGSLLCCIDASVSLHNVTLDGGYAQFGGAIFSSDCDLDMQHSVIRDVEVESDGGAMYLLGGNHVLESCVLEENTAGNNGGGLYATDFSDQPAQVSLVDNFFNGNVAAVGGGALYISGDSVTVGGVLSCESSGAGLARFVQNQAPEGGAAFIFRQGDLSASGCDFAEGNEDNTPDDVYVESVSTGYTYGDAASFTCDETGCQ